jgi:GNAT superfamily N-acetyltransferase
MQFSIRKATVEDAAAIAFVHVESWRSTYAGTLPEAFLASLCVAERCALWKAAIEAGEAVLFVAERGREIRGFACAGKLRAAIGGYDAELYAIYLLREFQGQGMGRRLLQGAAEALRGQGFTSLAVWVLAENPAVSFYRHLGGVEIARKVIELGGVSLAELAFGWPSLDSGF